MLFPIPNPIPFGIPNQPVAMLQKLIADKVAPYAELRKLFKDKAGYHAIFVLNGTYQEIQANATKISFSSDGRYITLSGTSADVAWVNNGLQDFCENRPIPIPEKFITYTSMLAKVL